MRTVLIAHANAAFANTLSSRLVLAGYRTITCPGPWPPALRCIRHDVGYCPLTEGADLLVYDPDLIGYDADGRVHSLTIESAQAHPDVPMLLAWQGNDPPASVGVIRAEVPTALPAASDPEAFVDQVRELIGPPYEATTIYGAAGARTVS